MKINRAQTRSPRPRDIGRCLKNFELRPEARGQVPLGDFEGLVSCLHGFRLRMQNTLGLLQIQERTSHIGVDRSFFRLQREHGRVASRSCCFHASFRGESVENFPASIHTHHVAVVEFLADLRIALVIDFVTGKHVDVGTKIAAIKQ